MKKTILMLLMAGGMYAQEQVFNVQRYCIDEQPFKKGECDRTGNEYSFVFLDTKKSNVVFFLTDIRLKYKIIKAAVVASDPNYTVYFLENEKEQLEMRINKQSTKIEFLYPNNHIYLTVGKSTKEVN
jgi:hypothetical protein